MSPLKTFLKEVAQPSPKDEHWFYGTCALGAHVILGAAFQALIPLPFWWVVVIGIILYLLKERSDIIVRGGQVSDSVQDTLAVVLGLLYTGPVWWPILAITVMGLYAYVRITTDND